MKIIITVINPELKSMADWLALPDVDENISADEFIEKFNGNTDSFRQRSVNWSEFNHARLNVSEISAERTDESTSFKAQVTIEDMDIYEVTKALHVPSPVAALFSRIGEKGLASSFNTLFKINRPILSAEAVRQLSKRGMKADAVRAEMVAEKEKATV